MKFLFDLQHPAHLHFFRPVIARLKEEHHDVLITARDKDILVELAGEYGIELVVFGTAKKGIINLGLELLYRQRRLNKIIRQFKPDVMMAIAGTYISLLGKLRRIPTHVFYDTEHATVSNLLAYPFATCIHVPRCYRKEIRWNHRRYNGYHELAYLHPNYFQADPSVPRDVGLQPGERFTLVRFVGWGAGHDIGLSGLDRQRKIRAVNRFKAFGPVFISCEGELPAELEPFRLRLPVHKIHSLMAHASLIFGESATMASEGAVMGVPGIYIDPVGRGYTDEQEKEYGIVFNFTPQQQDEAIDKGISILTQCPPNSPGKKWREIGQRIIDEKIDVTGMIYNIAIKKTSSLNDAGQGKPRR
jgi:predicted glycosyltransferase